MTSLKKSFIRLAHRLGISPLMLHARRGARKHGERLRFRRAFISWENAQGETFLLSPDRPHIIWWYIQSSREWMNRIVRSTDAPHSITDLRQPVLYRMSSGRHIWLPDIIEMIDTCAGYIGRGAPHPGDIVLDAGAFCGESTIELALLVGPTGRVFALEPDPRNIELLKRNLALHHLKMSPSCPTPFGMRPPSSTLPPTATRYRPSTALETTMPKTVT